MTNTRYSPLIHYRYDALNRLVGHGQSIVSQCQRFYCDSHFVTEINEDGEFSIVQYGDQLLAQQHQSGGVSSAVLATDATLHFNCASSEIERIHRLLAVWTSNLSPFEEGGLNAYAYCAGDPVNWVDRTGHSIFSALKFMFSSRKAQSRLPFSTPFQRTRVKPVKNVTKLSEGFVMFEDTFKGKP